MRPTVRFSANPPKPPGNPIDLQGLKKTGTHKIPQNVGMRLMLALQQQQKPPIPVFVSSKSGPLTDDQKKQLDELGVTVNHIAGEIHTGRIIDPAKFDLEKVEKLDFLVQIEAGAKMRPLG